MMNIVSCLALDENSYDKNIKYKALGKLPQQTKRKIYWKLAFVYFATSIKINHSFKHILFTNDNKFFAHNRFDFRKNIQDLGVEIRYLPFKNYHIPQGYSRLFKNAYYKFEIFHELALETSPSLFTDIDCIWANKWENLHDLLEKYDLLLYDVYQRSHKPLEKHPNNISMKDMGEIFHRLDLNYTSLYPIWYGGEFICTKPDMFKNISASIKRIFDHVVKSDNKEQYILPNGESLLDGDEYLSSFVYNNASWKVFHVNDYIKRIWTSDKFNNIDKNDLNLKIWHLPAEKISGFSMFFREIKNKRSIFWSLTPEKSADFIARYIGLKKQSSNFTWRRRYYYYKNKIGGKLSYFLSYLLKNNH